MWLHVTACGQELAKSWQRTWPATHSCCPMLLQARRYVRAAEVHRALTAGQAKHVAQRFPLLQHQWPLVKKFKPQVCHLRRDQAECPPRCPRNVHPHA